MYSHFWWEALEMEFFCHGIHLQVSKSWQAGKQFGSQYFETIVAQVPEKKIEKIINLWSLTC